LHGAGMTALTKQQLTALLDAAKSNPEFAIQQAFRFGAIAGKSDEATKAIKRFAEMLDYDAECLKACHAPDNNWSGEDEAKTDYDERKKVAKALRGLA
jgi:hypothetical protein